MCGIFETADGRAKRTKIGPLEQVFIVYRVLLTVKC